MASERIQRQIVRLLDEAEAAVVIRDWSKVRQAASDALILDPENAEGRALIAAAERALTAEVPEATSAAVPAARPSPDASPPDSFAGGRYTVTKFLGEGGKKKVYLAHDSLLDRDVALALIKTEGLDEAARQRVSREAQAMGRLGAHPNIVTVFDIGEENAQPFLILPVMNGGDVEGLIEDAPEHRLPLERAVAIAIDTCQGLDFSHSKGIVHRDLKPGNVWLTEDGRAMIGDFGLAVAVDKTRLTQAGMMVGTVNYMPPEQAMGGEVGPRSDLYSLGAMLYEMVCGRPPFVGDESVAIIGQHLNTPPVAPSWHRPDCPQGLESLILRLLEKDPLKRPASATEVREALESVTTTRAPSHATTTADLPAAGDNPLYRRTFVGRENEVRQLQQAFDAALSGQGGLVMVVGEPGIGKTALCEQLATYVALRGGKALVGHCYEEGSLSLPYLAFVEAMRSYVLAREPDGLRSDLGTGAADVARIISEVRDRVQGVELRPAGDPEDERWRLLQAITSFLRNASTVQPLCIVLEDLHWADRGTLDLLVHASRNLQGARLLVVGTYRDVEVDRSHPLSGTLADLRRGANFTRVPLRGLTVDEVHRMYESLRGNEVSWAQAEAVFRATEGNPLFVQEVLRYLVEEGAVVRQDGRYVAQGDAAVNIPEGLRDVVGKRLSRLSDKTNQALAIAAVMGRDFRLDVLQIVAGLPEEELYTALAEAVERAVIEERSGIGVAVAYRFAHAFFRTTLYEETIAPRRIRLHQQVARALETVYGRRLEEHAAELSEHYSYSSNPEDLKKAVEYGELAAQRASQVFDYGEAERHLQQALKVQEVLDPDDKRRRLDLLMPLIDSMLPQENPSRVVDSLAGSAFDFAVEREDNLRAARVAVRACEAMFRSSSMWAIADIGMLTPLKEWADRALAYAPAGSTELIYAEAYIGIITIAFGRPSEGHEHLRRAAALATDVEDNGAFFASAGTAVRYLNALRDRELVSKFADLILSRTHNQIRALDLFECLMNAGIRVMERGDRPGAEAAWQEAATLAGHSRDLTVNVAASGFAICLDFMDGRLEESLDLISAMEDRAREAGVRGVATSSSATVSPVLRAIMLSHLGRDMRPILATTNEQTRPGLSQRALVLAMLNEFSEVAPIVQRFGDIGSAADETASGILFALFHACVLCGDTETVAAVAPRFAPLAGELKSVGWTTVGRVLGDAALLLGKPGEARGFYDRAVEVCANVRHRPELALTRLSLAELLLEHHPDERDTAIEHLDFAIAELRDMKMQPALERALRHRGLLKA